MSNPRESAKQDVAVVLATLRRCDFFRDLSDNELEMISSPCTLTEFNEGDALVGAGHPRRNSYLIIEGRVGIFFKGYEEQVPVDILKVGDLVAATALLGTKAVTGFLPIALTPVRALVIPGGEMRELYERLPSIGYKVISRLAEYMIRRTYDVYEGLSGRRGSL